MRRLLILTTVTMLLAAACGGDSAEDGTDDGGDQTATTAGATTEPAPGDDGGDTSPPSDDTSPPSEDGGDAEGSGPSTATVSLGDQTYQFSTEGAVVAQCLTDLFGIFSIQLPRIDESGAVGDGSIAIIALREGTDPETVGEMDSVQVDVGDDTWVADEANDVLLGTEAFEPGMSQVDSVEIDGRTVRGTATFVRRNSLFDGGEVETMSGTFEATCGEERTS